MKKILLCLIAMIAIIAFTNQPARAIVDPVVVNNGPAVFDNNLGSMVFQNFDGVAPGYELIVIRPTVNPVPYAAITVTDPNFLWVKPSSTQGMNNFVLHYDHLTTDMTVTLTNSLGSQSATFTNWAAAIPGPQGPADINTINIHMVTGGNYPQYTMILRDIQINGVQNVPGILTVPNGGGTFDKIWNITGITAMADFTLTGNVDLPGEAYINAENFKIQFDFGFVGPGPGPSGEGLILWFDPMRIDNTNALGAIPPLPPLPADGDKVPLWMNQGNPLACVSADAPLPLPWKEPVFRLADFPTPWLGLNGWPGMNFTEIPVYGQSSVLAFAPSPLVTSDWPTSPVMPIVPGNYLPQLGKNLFIAFSTPDLQSPVPQVIFEAGGGVSGFNAYVQNGYLMMGIWNRLENAFFQMAEPLSPGTHIAHLEFQYTPPTIIDNVIVDPGVHQVRMILDGIPSQWVDFHGLQFDDSPSGIGSEVAGTMFFSRQGVFDDFARFFTGLVGDIKLYAGVMTPDAIQAEYNYYADRYGTASGIVVPVAPGKSAWLVNYDTKPNKDNSNLAEVFPNPFSNTATLSMNLTESQRVRIDIFDMTGVNVLSVYDGMASKGMNNFKLNGSSLPTGVYAVRISGDSFTTLEKIVLTK